MLVPQITHASVESQTSKQDNPTAIGLHKICPSIEIAWLKPIISINHLLGALFVNDSFSQMSYLMICSSAIHSKSIGMETPIWVERIVLSCICWLIVANKMVHCEFMWYGSALTTCLNQLYHLPLM